MATDALWFYDSLMLTAQSDVQFFDICFLVEEIVIIEIEGTKVVTFFAVIRIFLAHLCILRKIK